jgi:hypothetical protein
VEHLTGFNSKGRSALPANIRLQQKCLTVPNTLAYHDTELIMAVKNFIVQAPKLKQYSDKKLNLSDG